MDRMSRLLAYVGHPTVVGGLIALASTVLVVLLVNPHPPKSDDTVELFSGGHPLPTPHNIICPSDRLSLAKAIYTSTKGQLTYINGETCYKVSLREKQFMYILFCFHGTKTAPLISHIIFVFRDNEVAAKVKKLALSTFGSKNLKISPERAAEV